MAYYTKVLRPDETVKVVGSPLRIRNAIVAG